MRTTGMGTTRAISSDTAQHRRSLFMPRDNCPVPQAELANYRQTIVKYIGIDKPSEQYVEEARKSLNHKQQKRLLPGNIWRGETWFKVQPVAGERYNEQVRAQQMTAAQPQQNKRASKGQADNVSTQSRTTASRSSYRRHEGSMKTHRQDKRT